jgi:hypothetical protein
VARAASLIANLLTGNHSQTVWLATSIDGGPGGKALLNKPMVMVGASGFKFFGHTEAF